MIKLILKDSEGGEAQFPLIDTLLIGRGDECDIVLRDSKASRHHARVVLEGDLAYLEDLKSTNGTYVNSQAMTGRQALKSGDLVTVGASKIRVVSISSFYGYSATTSIENTVEAPPKIPRRNGEPDSDEPATQAGERRVSVPIAPPTPSRAWLFWAAAAGVGFLVWLLLANR